MLSLLSKNKTSYHRYISKKKKIIISNFLLMYAPLLLSNFGLVKLLARLVLTLIPSR